MIRDYSKLNRGTSIAAGVLMCLTTLGALHSQYIMYTHYDNGFAEWNPYQNSWFLCAQLMPIMISLTAGILLFLGRKGTPLGLVFLLQAGSPHLAVHMYEIADHQLYGWDYYADYSDLQSAVRIVTALFYFFVAMECCINKKSATRFVVMLLATAVIGCDIMSRLEFYGSMLNNIDGASELMMVLNPLSNTMVLLLGLSFLLPGRSRDVVAAPEFCKSCGQPMKPTAIFCAGCGQRR
ncbi:MAG: zinc ribbon domain-containing protein [Oscillospiraceae bacterium]|nr:zinc ribbon domain-containing protein [Oscillospiraceae bacterium]